MTREQEEQIRAAIWNALVAYATNADRSTNGYVDELEAELTPLYRAALSEEQGRQREALRETLLRRLDANRSARPWLYGERAGWTYGEAAERIAREAIDALTSAPPPAPCEPSKIERRLACPYCGPRILAPDAPPAEPSAPEAKCEHGKKEGRCFFCRARAFEPAAPAPQESEREPWYGGNCPTCGEAWGEGEFCSNAFHIEARKTPCGCVREPARYGTRLISACSKHQNLMPPVSPPAAQPEGERERKLEAALREAADELEGFAEEIASYDADTANECRWAASQARSALAGPQ